tara:strand:+ start:365 stop:616 length:252 start_codon:yes stop_codon:yes gene_type:complete
MNIKHEQLLHEIAAHYINGRSLEIDIKGTELQLECFQQLLESSKRLKVLLDEGQDYTAIKLEISTKKNLTKRFQNLTGITWKL